MAKFNKPKTGTKIINKAGGEAFKQSDKMELVSFLLTNLVKDQFYRSAEESLKRLTQLVNGIPDKIFIAKAAIFARTKYGMRSISHYTAALLGKHLKGLPEAKKFYNKVIYRPDDITEILGAYIKVNEGNEVPYPNSMKKGIAKALEGFNEYELAKYMGTGKDISMVDVVNYFHPRSTTALTKLVKGELVAKQGTWEKKLSESGKEVADIEDKEEKETKQAELKKQAWSELLKENKLGYMALLKNLRNIIEQAPEALPLALEQLVDANRIKNSLVFPYRYLTAIDEIGKINAEGARQTLVALNKAIDIACSNVKPLPGKTLIALDVSGSMQGKPMEIGALFAAITYKAMNADVMRFDGMAKYETPNPADSTLTIANQLKMNGGSTNFHAIFEHANKAYDNIIILSDMQAWVGYDAPTRSLNVYKTKYKANPNIFCFDLQGYGEMSFPETQVYQLAGFSEKVFDVLAILTEDRDALINQINAIEL